MLVIGLTGGIASGKSLVGNFFTQYGIDVFDTDTIARECVQPTTPAYKKLVEHFGTEILDNQLKIDRSKLRKIIFHDSEQKKWLETLLHPLIRQRTKELISSSISPYCLVIIPLLYETWPNPLIDRVLVVDCEPQIQLKRLKNRDNIDQQLANKMLQQQASREQRLSIANDIVTNNNGMEQLYKDIDELHKHYLKLVAGEIPLNTLK